VIDIRYFHIDYDRVAKTHPPFSLEKCTYNFFENAKKCNMLEPTHHAAIGYCHNKCYPITARESDTFDWKSASCPAHCCTISACQF
jgi:hypothetical protein